MKPLSAHPNPPPTPLTEKKRERRSSREMWELSQVGLGLLESHPSLCPALTHATAVIRPCYQWTTGPIQGQVTLWSRNNMSQRYSVIKDVCKAWLPKPAFLNNILIAFDASATPLFLLPRRSAANIRSGWWKALGPTGQKPNLISAASA